MAKVSICIPAYKDVTGVARLLDSVSTSEYRDTQIIVSDDTPDDTVERCLREHAPAGIPLTYIHNDTPLGPAGNWNRAIASAEGEYIKIMHQDDWFTTPESLGRFVGMLDDAPGCVMAFSGSRQVRLHDGGRDVSDHYDRHITDEQLKLVEADPHNLFLGGYIGAPSAVIYRNCDLRFDDELKWLIDSDFYIRLLENDNRFAYTTDPLVSIGMSDDQLTQDVSHSREVNIAEHKHLYEKYDLSHDPAYRDKLISVCVEYGGRYPDIADCGIARADYNRISRAHKAGMRRFYLKLIRRKLFGGDK